MWYMRVLILLPMVIAAMPLWDCADALGDERRIFEKNSPYQYVSVWEDSTKGERYIRNKRRDLDQGGVSLRRPDSLLIPYTQLMFMGLAFLDREPRDTLFVGMGAGSMPRYLSRYYPAAAIDAVEIDPVMIEVARKWFFFREMPNLKVHPLDGRIFIKRTKKNYDVIFLDAYQNDYIPFHLTTVEFLREVKGRLREGGVVVSNILADDYNKFFDSMLATYRKVFPQVYVFKMKYSINYVFVATMDGRLLDRERVVKRAHAIQKTKGFDFDLNTQSLWHAHSSVYARDGADILTDDFAPVNIFKYQKTRRNGE